MRYTSEDFVLDLSHVKLKIFVISNLCNFNFFRYMGMTTFIHYEYD